MLSIIAIAEDIETHLYLRRISLASTSRSVETRQNATVRCGYSHVTRRRSRPYGRCSVLEPASCVCHGQQTCMHLQVSRYMTTTSKHRVGFWLPDMRLLLSKERL